MRFALLSACLVITISTGIAHAQTPVAYVYVGQDAVSTEYSAISAFSASSTGKLTALKGSPFTQAENTGIMVGTNGTHFIFAGYWPAYTGGLSYLYSYDVGSDGVLGKQVSAINTASFNGANCPSEGGSLTAGAVLDHTGQYVYQSWCDNAEQTYKISSSGALTFQTESTDSNSDTLGGMPKIAGNDAFAYTLSLENDPMYHYTLGLTLWNRASNGSLEYSGDAAITWPDLPADYYASIGENYQPLAFTIPAPSVTNDGSNHFAALLGIGKFIPPDTTTDAGCAIASFTMGSHGQLTSTNTYAEMPKDCGLQLLLSPSGKVLALNTGLDLKFYHFNGASPITKLGEIVGKSGAFGTMAWDKAGHLYALNTFSGRLHVYTVSSSSVTEAPGSPYSVPFCGIWKDSEFPPCPQTLVVRSIP